MFNIYKITDIQKNDNSGFAVRSPSDWKYLAKSPDEAVNKHVKYLHAVATQFNNESFEDFCKSYKEQYDIIRVEEIVSNVLM